MRGFIRLWARDAAKSKGSVLVSRLFLRLPLPLNGPFNKLELTIDTDYRHVTHVANNSGDRKSFKIWSEVVSWEFD